MLLDDMELEYDGVTCECQSSLLGCGVTGVTVCINGVLLGLKVDSRALGSFGWGEKWLPAKDKLDDDDSEAM